MADHELNVKESFLCVNKAINAFLLFVLRISMGDMFAFAENATGCVGAGIVDASEIHARHSLQLDRQHLDAHPLAEPSHRRQ
ncbi:hypothetical protein [Pseudomonas fluorescens]|uniref:hypothetical protein n=1 Tax=Pseudomonas fluorescens TaxID=294 RepID=UPI001242050C|nr:hypothetical protein [Pseudomonas fluorescens]